MKPTIVQHAAGAAQTGGPATALARLLASPLANRYEFVEMRQTGPAGGLDLRLIRHFVRTVRAAQPDLVHVRGLGNEGFHGVLAARLAGASHILVTIHGTVRDLSPSTQTWRTRLISRVLEPLTLRLAHHVATVCEYAADRPLVADAKRRGKFVGVVPNGVDPPEVGRYPRGTARTKLGLESDEVAFAVVGRLSIEKGFFALADALERLPPVSPRIHLLIAGNGPDRDLVEQRLKSSSTPRVAVTFLGQVDDVYPVLVASDVFLFPTLHENMSNALLEAMSVGLPALATAVGGNTEVLNAGGGVLVPPNDPEALSREIHRLASQPALRAQLGQAAAQNIARNYSQSISLGRLDTVYSDCLGSGP